MRSVLRLALFLLLAIPLGSVSARAFAAGSSATFSSAGRTIHYEVFSGKDSGDGKQVVILLPGVSGSAAPFYREQCDFYARHGFEVLLLNYYDATESHASTDKNYMAWAQALADLVQQVSTQRPGARIFVIGYSLGASIALAAGSQGLPVAAIAEWYGSLPDYAFDAFKSMPPLLILHGARDTNIPVMNAQQLIRLCDIEHLVCENNIYPDQAHGFTEAALTDAERRTLAFFANHSTAIPPVADSH